MKLGRNIIKSRHPPKKKITQSKVALKKPLESNVRDFNIESNVRPDLGLDLTYIYLDLDLN